MDNMLTGEDQSQADQPNSLAEGPPQPISQSLGPLVTLVDIMLSGEDQSQADQLDSLAEGPPI
eukprot:1154380-Pelagomonas_calceolata.AAC.1